MENMKLKFIFSTINNKDTFVVGSNTIK